MKYTIFCPCHDEPTVVSTGEDGAVVAGEQMTCAHCSCIHRVADVEDGATAGRVRLARMSDEELTAAYAELGMTLIRVTCPPCGADDRALQAADADPSKTSVLFCSHCHLPMIVETVGDGFIAREPDAVEKRSLILQALRSVRSTADRIDDLFPETAFGRDPFTGL